MTTSKNRSAKGEDIAIVGMSVNVPGAAGVDAYWANLRDGVESIRRLSEQELLDAGESPENIARKNYVPSAAIMDDFDTFDPDFFGFSPKDASILDPLCQTSHQYIMVHAVKELFQIQVDNPTLAGCNVRFGSIQRLMGATTWTEAEAAFRERGII